MLFYSTIWDGIPKFALFVAVAIILVSLADWLPKIRFWFLDYRRLYA